MISPHIIVWVPARIPYGTGPGTLNSISLLEVPGTVEKWKNYKILIYRKIKGIL